MAVVSTCQATAHLPAEFEQRLNGAVLQSCTAPGVLSTRCTNWTSYCADLAS